MQLYWTRPNTDWFAYSRQEKEKAMYIGLGAVLVILLVLLLIGVLR